VTRFQVFVAVLENSTARPDNSTPARLITRPRSQFLDLDPYGRVIDACIVALYFLSKVFWFVAEPAHVMSLLLTLAVILIFTRWRRLGLGLASLVALQLFMIAVLPVGRWLLSPLENRFPVPNPMPAHVDGIIMLGGEESDAFYELGRRYPKARLVFAGGEPPDGSGTYGEAGWTSKGLQRANADTGRIIFEAASRNTFEDVTYAKAIMHPTPGEIWILITGAFHVPRSVGLFRGQGWEVLPYPVNYGVNPGDHISSIHFTQNLDQLSIALKEWIGMIVNRLLGHSPEYFPSPLHGLKIEVHDR
jgi:uncharacterized SAM-binding protein YcdF (DUF218 family)